MLSVLIIASHQFDDENKSLLDINGVPVITRQLALAKSLPRIADIVVVIGYNGGQVYEKSGRHARVVENELHYLSNTARSIELGLRVIKTRGVLIINGPLLLNEAALKTIIDKESLVWLCHKREHDVGVSVNNNKVLRFAFGLPYRWPGVMYLQGKELSLFRSIMKEEMWRRHFTHEVLNEIIERGGEFTAVHPIGGKMLDMACYKDVLEARRTL